MPLTLEEACKQDGPSSVACAARDKQESARRELSIKTCARIFADQEVMQTACISSCRSYTSGDGQDCAFAFSRSLHEVAVQKPGSGGTVWLLVLMAALLAGVCWAVFRRLKARV